MSITILTIVFTVAISFYAWGKPQVLARFTMSPYRVRRYKEYDRFLLSGFVHTDYMHLFFNMFTLYYFGSAVDTYFSYYTGGGKAMFLLLYILGIVVSDIPTFIKHKNDPRYNSLGASGGVSAVLFSSILFVPMNDICLFGVLCIPGFIFGPLYLIYSAYLSRKSVDNVNHDAHIYGAIFGVAFTLALVPETAFSFAQQIVNWRLF